MADRMKLGLSSVVLCLMFFSCASGNPYAKIDSHAQRNEYQEGLAVIDKDKKKLYRDKDAVLYYLDAGMLSHYAAEYRRSTELLQAGERAIETAYTKSITMEIGTYILNDTTQEYAGEDYEDIFINTFNALNYYHENELEDAMVEIRRMNNKLQFLSSKYGIIVDNMQKKALEEDAAIPPDPAAGKTTFTNSALARYLGMLFYRGNGNYDDARIDRDQIKIAFANNPSVYAYPAPASIDEELTVPAGKARFNVIGFSGSAPVKEEETLRILIPGPRYIKIALPVLVNRPSVVNRITVRFDSGESFNLELLEDIGAIAKETFKERANLAYLKSVIRGTLKGVTSSVLDGVGDEVGGNAGLVMGLLSIGTQVFAEASEKADLRISRYFPAKAYVGGITLDPGTYSYTVIYYSGSRVVDSLRQENVEIRARGLNLAEAVCLK
ncbi:COG3014 family protein [Treponema primitia]|uniref:COG3014 family protein n=1 Tax=Treponema primitia TaxID=88058 RepID=UPI0012FDB76E|nr:hypothetical protein [Treponema primitia]